LLFLHTSKKKKKKIKKKKKKKSEGLFEKTSRFEKTRVFLKNLEKTSKPQNLIVPLKKPGFFTSLVFIGPQACLLSF
jgi:hypothetical protein